MHTDGADRLREHWDQEGCSEANLTTVEQCSRSLEGHTEWRTSMSEEDEEAAEAEADGMSAGTAVSVVISTLLVLTLLCIGAGFLYVYGRSNPGGLAERVALRMERNYKRFGGGGGGSSFNAFENNNDVVESGKQQQLEAANNNSSSSSVNNEVNSTIVF